MKRMLSLPVVALASLMIVNTGVAKDSLKDHLHLNKHTRNDILIGLGAGLAGGVFTCANLGNKKSLTKEQQDQAAMNGVHASTALLIASQAYDYKENHLSLKSGLTQTVSAIAGFFISVVGIQLALDTIAKMSSGNGNN